MSTTFLHAWRRRTDMEPGTDGPVPWLYGIAANLVRRHLRGVDRRQHGETASRTGPGAARHRSPAVHARSARSPGASTGRSRGAHPRVPSRRPMNSSNGTLQAARASVMTYVMPAVALGLGVGVLGERLDAQILVGLGLVLVGLWLSWRSPRSPRFLFLDRAINSATHPRTACCPPPTLSAGEGAVGLRGSARPATAEGLGASYARQVSPKLVVMAIVGVAALGSVSPGAWVVPAGLLSVAAVWGRGPHRPPQVRRDHRRRSGRGPASHPDRGPPPRRRRRHEGVAGAPLGGDEHAVVAGSPRRHGLERRGEAERMGRRAAQPARPPSGDASRRRTRREGVRGGMDVGSHPLGEDGPTRSVGCHPRSSAPGDRLRRARGKELGGMPARGTGYAGGKEFQAPGGESVADLRHRIQEFLRGLGEGDHLVFTHGGVIRYLLPVRPASDRRDELTP